ncbi:MAG: TonB-dependent receptor plug domain-containing protein [Caulobacteraceae bacterium]
MRALSISSLLVALASPALADPPSAVGPLVVTATLIATPLDQVGSSLTLITAQDIETHQWRTLPAALADAPGLNLVQVGGPGGQTSVFIRGANANHTKVVIDGIDVNDPSQNGAFDFGQVLTADLARVEILRGPQSSLYGSDALGGVINIVTRKGNGPPRFTASLEGGSFATFDQTAALSGSAGTFNYAVDLAHFRSGDTPVTPLGLLAPGEKAVGEAYDNSTASAKLGIDPTATFGLGLVVRYTGARLLSTGEDFSVFPAVPDAAQTDQVTRQFFARGQARLSLFSSAFLNLFGVGYTDYRTRIQAPDEGFGLAPPTFDRGDRIKFDWLGTITLSPRHTLVLGLQDDVDRLIDSPISARDGDRAAFAELQSRPFSGLTFAASARYDNDDRFGGKTTWRIAPAYTIPATGTELKASYGTGFKAPSLTQLFVSFPEFDFFANPRLRPEQSEGYDIGFEQPAAGGALRFGATWFHESIRNLIDSDATGTSLANIGRATTYGAESFVSLALDRRLTLRADYTYTVARDDVAHQQLLRRPKDKADLTAGWRPNPRLRLSASLLYVGAWIDGNRDFSIPRLEASPYATVDLAASYALTNGVTLFGRIDNLLDRRYQNPVGFLQPGFGAVVGVRVAFPAKARS